MSKFHIAAALIVSVLACYGCSPEKGGTAIGGWENIGKDDSGQEKPGPDTPGPDKPEEQESFFKMRGLVLGWSEVSNSRVIDYVSIARRNGINTFSVYNAPRGTQVWTDFEKRCADAGIDIEYEEHMMSFLLPRELFETYPDYFRMDKNGNRTNDANGCPSSEGAIAQVNLHAKDICRNYRPTNSRYYCWLDDGGDICYCPKCKGMNAADQALIFENAIIESMREIVPEATLAHLAYNNTSAAPKSVSPADGIFLEFAPFFRTWEEPLANGWAVGRDGKMTHADCLRDLRENLEVFPSETAQVLEYWMDDSLFSGWDTSNLVEVPWKKDVFMKDIETYASFGIHNVTCYAAYVGPSYVQKFGYPKFIDEYGQGLRDYGKDR